MRENGARGALLACCLAYLALGAFTAAVGPLLPQLATQAGVTLAAAGALFTAMFSGGLIAQVVSGPASDRFGQRPVLLTGLVLMALGGIGIVSSRSLAMLLGTGLFAGLGHGSVDIGGNLLIATTFAKRKVSALNFLHLFFGLGSVFGPAAVSLTHVMWGTGLPSLWLVILVTVLLWPLLYRVVVPQPGGTKAAGERLARVYSSPLLWAFAGLLGVYVGIEVAVGGWTTTYLADTINMALESAALVTSGYWLALTGGRLISAGIGNRLGPYRLLALDLAGAIIAACGLIAGTGHQAGTIAATLLLGLSFGSVYPTVMALVTTLFQANPGKAASVITAAGSLGGMSLPLLMGLLLTGRGPASSPWFALACCAAMVVLFAALAALRPRRQAALTSDGLAHPGVAESVGALPAKDQ